MPKRTTKEAYEAGRKAYESCHRDGLFRSPMDLPRTPLREAWEKGWRDADAARVASRPKQVNVRFDQDTLDWIKREARRWECSMAEVVRQAVSTVRQQEGRR